MALRFNLPFYSLNFGSPGANEEWEVELWDSSHVGAATEVTGTPEGLRIEWEGTNDLIGPLMPSSATYSILIEEEADMALVTAVAGAAEGRFKMVVRRAGSTEVYWAGWVHADDSSYPDNYFPFHFELYATDGIARLKDVDYMDGETFFEGEETIIQHLVRIIEKIGTHDVGTWPAARIRSTANWYANGMNTTTCPLNQALARNDRFEGLDREGNAQPWSYYTVLDALLRFQNCQLLHEGGMYHVRQLDSYADATQKAHYYDAAGAWLSSATENMDRTVDYATATGMRKGAGGRYTWLPPLKEVCVDYHHVTSNDRGQGQVWNTGDETWHTLPGSVIVDDPDTTYLRCNLKVRHKSNLVPIPPGSQPYPDHRFRFNIQVRMEDGTTPGSHYYLKRPGSFATPFFDIQPGEMEWFFEGADLFTIWARPINDFDNNIEFELTLGFTTPSLPVEVSGSPIQMKIELEGAEKPNGGDVTIDGITLQGAFTWYTLGVSVKVEEEGGGEAGDNETLRTCAEATGENTEKRYIDTYLGDGPAPFSLSALHVGATATTGWKIGNAGTAKPIAKLLAEQVLRFRKKPQDLFQVDFLHRGITPLDRFVDADVAWMATRISLSAFENRWGGEFVLVDGDVDGISTSEPHTPDGPLPPHTPPDYPGPPYNPQGPVKEGLTVPPFDGLHGGTLPGYVNGSEAAPATLTAGLLASDYNTDHELTVSAVAFSWAKKGDRVTLVNPINGHRETFTLRTSYVPGDTTLYMKTTGETMVKDWPYGTFVKLTKADELRVKGWSYYQRDVTGTGATKEFWAVPLVNVTDPDTAGPGGTLPNPTLTDPATIRERVKVWMGNTVLLYNPNPYDDAFGIKPSTNEIEVYIGIPADVTMFVEVR